MLIERLAKMYVQWGAPKQSIESDRRRNRQIQAVREFLEIIQKTGENRKELFEVSQQSKRKATKLSYLLLASDTEPAAVRDSFLRSGLLFKGQQNNKPDLLMWLAGTEACARGIHPYIVFLIMSAYSGLEAANSEFLWLRERSKLQNAKLTEYIVPGDLTDNIEEALSEPLRFKRTIRIAGMPLAASAFAGCSLYYIEQILALVGPIGSFILTEMIAAARKRLISDEICTAQQAFLDLYSRQESESSALDKGLMTGMEAFEESSQPDPDLIRTTTDIIMSAEAKILKATLSSMSDNEIASLLRCIEPIAHERLLSLISQGRQRRILTAIQHTDNVTGEKMLRDAQLFAQKLLSSYAPRNLRPGETLKIPELLRNLISSLLGRE
ncbi:MAG: hypothetical protein KBB90_03690 [Spirochaetia bacterium]|nr:hypothetical protein [Spirochaetia bacterium]MDI9428029.1 hypothetical protein [Spirochaetota bacterium]HPD69424.1 hypothetical protein [Rectinema sp.]